MDFAVVPQLALACPCCRLTRRACWCCEFADAGAKAAMIADTEAAESARRKLMGARTPRAQPLQPRSHRSPPRAELEERVPWRQVKKYWNTRREAWLMEVTGTLNCGLLGKLMLLLEAALKQEALSPTCVPLPSAQPSIHRHSAPAARVETAPPPQVAAESRELAPPHRLHDDAGAPRDVRRRARAGDRVAAHFADGRRAGARERAAGQRRRAELGDAAAARR